MHEIGVLPVHGATGARSDKDSPDYWAARATETFPPGWKASRPRHLLIYLLNLVHLRPGQGTFQPNGTPQVLDGEPAGSPDRLYRTPSDDFELSCIDLATGSQYLGQAAYGPDSIIVLDGAATLTSRGRSSLLARGAIVLVPFGTHYSLNAGVTPAMLFKASIPGQTDFVPGSK